MNSPFQRDTPSDAWEHMILREPECGATMSAEQDRQLSSWQARLGKVMEPERLSKYNDTTPTQDMSRHTRLLTHQNVVRLLPDDCEIWHIFARPHALSVKTVRCLPQEHGVPLRSVLEASEMI